MLNIRLYYILVEVTFVGNYVGEEFDARSSFSEYETIKELGEGGFGRVVLG